MKRFVKMLLIAVVSVMSLSSCATMLPSRFDSLANNAEKHGENYTLRKWERKNDKFRELCGEYKDNFTRYTASERRRIHSDIITYGKSAAKSGVLTVTDMATGLIEEVREVVKDAKELWEDLGLSRKKDRKPSY